MTDSNLIPDRDDTLMNKEMLILSFSDELGYEDVDQHFFADVSLPEDVSECEEVISESEAVSEAPDESDGAPEVQEVLPVPEFVQPIGLEPAVDSNDGEALYQDLKFPSMEEVPQAPRKVRRETPEKKSDIVKERAFRVLFEVLGILRYTCICLLVGAFVHSFVMQRNDVVGSSMEKTLLPDDVLWVEMVSHFFRGYQRGDIVILDASEMHGRTEPENRFVKRVIALPYETITIEGGMVYINGALLNEPYLAEGITTLVAGTSESFSLTLGTDEYFCMGDNRPRSLDSRILGPFTIDRIKGRALVRVYPFDSIDFFIGG